MTEDKKDNCELQSAQEEVSKNAGYSTWSDLIEQNEHDHKFMRDKFEKVALLLSYSVQDFRMAYEPWGKVIDHVQNNHPPDLKLGSHISDYVLKLVQEVTPFDFHTDKYKAYNQGYRDASKKAIEIITKGL